MRWLSILVLLGVAGCGDAPSKPESAGHVLQDQQDMLNDAKATANALEMKLEENAKKLDALRDEGNN